MANTKYKTVCISLPDSLLNLIDTIKAKRQDAGRSDTIRVLLLQALASMSYFDGETKKALGLNLPRQSSAS